ncbi:MAG: hypothetical protein FXF54_03765 [Kosmotoga sp.]|nr:MAG: hypothetical protein FXF54_03765 [Kosmotoga sp.]
MIRIGLILFFAGAICTYLPLFFGEGFSVLVFSVIGMLISLYIWYALAWNRDLHYKKLEKKGLFKNESKLKYKLKKNSVKYAILYSISYITMNVTGLYSMQIIIDNIEPFEGEINPEEIMNLLSNSYYPLLSLIFVAASVISFILFYKLIEVIYNDEAKMQALESKNGQVPLLIKNKISVWFVVIFTLLTYGLFSWYIRYRIMAVQLIHAKLEEQFSAMKKRSMEKAKEFEEKKKRRENLTDELENKYTKLLNEVEDNKKRKEIIASLFRDLGGVQSKKAREIIKQLLEKNVLSENEYRKLNRLLA